MRDDGERQGLPDARRALEQVQALPAVVKDDGHARQRLARKTRARSLDTGRLSCPRQGRRDADGRSRAGCRRCGVHGLTLRRGIGRADHTGFDCARRRILRVTSRRARFATGTDGPSTTKAWQRAT